MLTKIDIYILKKYLTSFFFSLSLFLMITVVFDAAEKLDDFIDNQAPLEAIIFDYYFNFLPYFAVVFCPLFTFIAVIFFTSKMAYTSEIIAILNSGTSYYRMLRPYFIGAVIIGGLDWYAINWIVPEANKKKYEFECLYIYSNFYNTSRNIHLQLEKNIYAYLENYNVKDSSGFKFALEHFDNNKLQSKLMGRKIKWNSKKDKWTVSNYSIIKLSGIEEVIEQGEKIDTSINMYPKDFTRKIVTLPNMNTEELNTFIEQERQKGTQNLEYYLIEKHKRSAFPFATLVLTLMGVSLASRKVRGGRGLHIAIGIALSFTYIVFMQFSTTFSTNANLSPLLGVWIPNIVFTLLGLYLLKIAPK
ncbi:MAG: LptF/LptG family permease [Bacteroidetes bacterium]|nr:LptF/LptG family permease [Bacteroidota bacterium]